jgi:uncharacterized protein YfbU (UPF0304 family)
VRSQNCRAAVLRTFRSLQEQTARDVFDLIEVVDEIKATHPEFKESTVRTFVSSPY